MTMTANLPIQSTPGRRKDGLVGLWGRIVYRDSDSYERWLEDRDLTIVTACLMRLNERQLNRLGFSHATLCMDVEDLAERARRDAEICLDVLRLVEDEEGDPGAGHRNQRSHHHAVAAE